MSNRQREQQQKLSARTAHSQPKDYLSQTIPAAAPSPQPASSPEFKHKTFLLTPELIDHIKTLASTYNVGQNELMRHLIGWAIEQVQSGDYVLPLRPRQTLD